DLLVLASSRCFHWREIQILVVKAEIRKRRHRHHREVIDGAVRFQGKSEERIFDGAVPPMCFESAVLPMLQVRNSFRGVVESEDQFAAFHSNRDWAVPG